MPGCHSLERVGSDSDDVLCLRAEVTVGVSLVKARYRAEIEISERRPGVSLRLKARGSSSLGVGHGDGRVRLEPLAGDSEPCTRLHYDYTAEVGGKVAAVGPRMLEGAAQLILRQLFEAIGRQVAHRAQGSAESSVGFNEGASPLNDRAGPAPNAWVRPWVQLWARLTDRVGKTRP